MVALIAPAAKPLSKTANTPKATWLGGPLTSTEARQDAIVRIIPAERSKPPVNTTKVWAIATSARTTPLFDSEVRTLTESPFGWFAEKSRNITVNTRKAVSGPTFHRQNLWKLC